MHVQGHFETSGDELSGSGNLGPPTALYPIASSNRTTFPMYRTLLPCTKGWVIASQAVLKKVSRYTPVSQL